MSLQAKVKTGNAEPIYENDGKMKLQSFLLLNPKESHENVKEETPQENNYKVDPGKEG